MPSPSDCVCRVLQSYGPQFPDPNILSLGDSEIPGLSFLREGARGWKG